MQNAEFDEIQYTYRRAFYSISIADTTLKKYTLGEVLNFLTNLILTFDRPFSEFHATLLNCYNALSMY